MKKAYVFLADGFEEIEAMAPIDILIRAGMDVTLVSVTDNLVVKSTRGIGVVAHKQMNEVNFDDANLLVLPGGQPGADHLDRHYGLKKVILDANQKGIYIAAICAAPQVLGHLGLLKGKNATCYPGMEKELVGATVTGQPVEIAGNIITGKGAGASFKFSLALVELLMGKSKALEIKEKMMID